MKIGHSGETHFLRVPFSNESRAYILPMVQNGIVSGIVMLLQNLKETVKLIML